MDMHGVALKLKYRFRSEDRKDRAGGGIRNGSYSTRTGNSHGATGTRWGRHATHPTGMSGRTLSKRKGNG